MSYKKDENPPDSAVFKVPDLVGIVDFFLWHRTVLYRETHILAIHGVSIVRLCPLT